MKWIPLVVALAVAAGCATDSGIVQTGPNTYFVSEQAATGFSGLGGLHAEVLKQAYAQCSKSSKSVEVVSSQESKPPYIFGNYPRVEVTFRCVSPN